MERAAEQPAPVATADYAFELALLSDVGTDRPDNEDFCEHYIEGPASAVFVVADGVGGYEGGEIASRMAVEITLQAYRESPPAWGAGKRLQRAVQQANIEIHNRALTVPELRRMATTLTAVAVDRGALSVAHVGDCRLYLIRRSKVSQISKDHTWVGERVRIGLMSASQARNHPERSALNRCVGHELIVSVDRISMTLQQGDRIVLCSDGLYNVLEERELERITREVGAQAACRALIDAANARGTADNLTAAVFLMAGTTPEAPAPAGLGARIARIFGRRR
ncbi:MAG: protein phosphatase 2C domain-containing protein [Candidatus Binataceae bacterium]